MAPHHSLNTTAQPSLSINDVAHLILQHSPLAIWTVPVIFTVLLTVALIKRRERCHTVSNASTHQIVEEKLPYTDISDDNISSSPFLAFLGHNILTESFARDPINTSVHAIDRIPGRTRLRALADLKTMKNVARYQQSQLGDRSQMSVCGTTFTYPDSPNRQVCVAGIEQVCAEDERKWQRRTLHICGI